MQKDFFRNLKHKKTLPAPGKQTSKTYSKILKYINNWLQNK